MQSALEMYTINAAFVMRQETTTGSLKVSKMADFVVIDQDPFKANVDISKSKVVQTVVGGEEVWSF